MKEEKVIGEVGEALRQELGELQEQEIDKCLRIWRDFVEERDVANTRKPETWAAAVYYIFSDISFWLSGKVTQREAGERFGVSENTVQAKQKEIRNQLQIGFIDERYTPDRAIEKFKKEMPRGIEDFLADTSGIEPSTGRESQSPADDEVYERFLTVREDLFDYAMEKFEDEIEDAAKRFEELDPLRSTNAGFVDWFVFDRESSEGTTPAELYVQEKGDSLPQEISDYIRRWTETEDLPYFVEKTKPETGEIILTEPETGKLYRVTDYSGSEQLEEERIIVTRLFAWFDGFHLSGDLSVFPEGIQPFSVEIDLEGVDVDPSEIDLMTPLSTCLICLERARLGKKNELTDDEALEKAMKNLAPALAELAAGDKEQALSHLERYSPLIQRSLDRLNLTVEPRNRIDDLNEPLTDDLMGEWHHQASKLSDLFEDREHIVGNGLVVLLAKARAVEEGRNVQPGDLQWSSDRLIEDKNFLEKIADTI
ncbi:hypothetical protein AKJ52_01810 [candidate division MSBL1 archaeon SCGC-AAA382C18]|uniref:DUF6398 domain-containing protein n=1 Tax=candidate division MSBL1 archaeon SCGC-AAA382C18 TaxID=1698281 RepID=A0A133VJU1_9EURY|nr:hypothetical protein AKJ52_01810 [candidate division MSBL1 archaeon SCGC-AAA382C18]